MLDGLLAALAPHICCNCRNVGTILCVSCMNDVMEEPFDCCVACLKPTAASNLCSDCRRRLPFHDAFAVSWRSDAVKQLIDDFKFHSRREAVRPLAYLLDGRLPILPPGCLVVPIPTLRAHIRQRGYDHARLIAEALARRRKLSLAQLLVRRSTAVQHGAARSKRLEQAKSMFSLVPDTPDSPILLIDDIYTTGATVMEAAKLLHATHRQPVYLAVIARQPLVPPELPLAK